jgi:hypothetical protein
MPSADQPAETLSFPRRSHLADPQLSRIAKTPRCLFWLGSWRLALYGFDVSHGAWQKRTNLLLAAAVAPQWRPVAPSGLPVLLAEAYWWYQPAAIRVLPLA